MLGTYECCARIEGFSDEPATEEEVIEAFQELIDTGVVWTLQGFYGRNAARLIDLGICTPATTH